MRNLGFAVACLQLTTLWLLAGCVSGPGLPHDGPASGGGPYNFRVGEGGDGIKRPWNSITVNDRDGAPWSISGWVKPRREQAGVVVLMGLGEAPTHQACRCVLLEDGKLAMWLGGDWRLYSAAHLPVGSWSAIMATYDGWTARLYVDGIEMAMNRVAVITGDLEPPNIPAVQRQILVVPANAEGASSKQFDGWLADLTFHPRMFRPKEVAAIARKRPEFDAIEFATLGNRVP